MEAIAKSEVKRLEQEFVSEFKVGINGVIKAANILVRLIEVDPEARTRLIEEYNIPRSTLVTMERIGNKLLRPELAFGDARLRALPMSDQERVLSGKIDVLVMKENGETDVLQVDLKTTTPEIKNQVLNGDHIRPLNEQKAWLVGKNNQSQKATTETETVPWRTYGRKQVEVIKAHTVLNRSDLLSMMKAIEG
jgi:hypothetical protein